MLSLGLGGLTLQIAAALGAALAVWLGIKSYGAKRKQQGKAEAKAEIATHNAAVQQEMAKINRPTDDEALKRLEDGTA